MPKTILNPGQQIFTRRALANMLQSHQHEREPNPPRGARARSTFPLTLTVGLMTIGVIAIISILQLLTAYFG